MHTRLARHSPALFLTQIHTCNRDMALPKMHGLASGIKRDAASASESVTDLKQLDRVKSNMESACSTLKEATELSSLFVKVSHFPFNLVT